MADIFLSYAREDWARVKPLAESLEALGWSLWWDTRMRAGLRFDEMIEAEIAAARCVLVVWSDASVRSHWVRAEAGEALEQHKLIPVFLDVVKAPLLFRHVQGLDLEGWQGSGDDPRFLRLIEDVSQLTGPPATQAAQTALEVQTTARATRPQSATLTRPSRSRAGRSTTRKAQDADLAEPEMVPIAPGTFLMGSAKGEGYASERPQHEVRIARPFALGRYAITFDEYDVFAKAAGRKLPGDAGWGRGRRPAVNVSWDDATAYAQWLSERTGKRYRLPTEAEWEYAARAGTMTIWSCGSDDGDLDRYAWYAANASGKTHPVGEKAPNPSGLCDVHGNVWEWVQDCWHDSYDGAPTDGSAWGAEAGGDCERRVVRGGSWFDVPGDLRSALRFRYGTDYRHNFLGFRLAQDL